MGVHGELGKGDPDHGESKNDMSISRWGAKDPGGEGAHDAVVSEWNVPYSSVLGAGLRGSIDDSMHVAGAS
jgi:hypothetical protein